MYYFTSCISARISYASKFLILYLMQIGVVLKGTSVDYTVVGGPAYSSKQIAPGDSVLRIDGVKVTVDNIKTLLVGNDIPGSPVSIALGRGGSKVDYLHFHNFYRVLTGALTMEVMDSVSRPTFSRCCSTVWPPTPSQTGANFSSSSPQ
jgi:hypothetical protein